jgi:hypothetical protein
MDRVFYAQKSSNLEILTPNKQHSHLKSTTFMMEIGSVEKGQAKAKK